MSATLSKTTSVYEHAYNTTYILQDDEGAVVGEVYVSNERSYQLGNPQQITVTIEAGDKLNESVCVLDGDGDFWVQAPDGNFRTADDFEACGFDGYTTTLDFIDNAYGIDAGIYVPQDMAVRDVRDVRGEFANTLGDALSDLVEVGFSVSGATDIIIATIRNDLGA